MCVDVCIYDHTYIPKYIYEHLYTYIDLIYEHSCTETDYVLWNREATFTLLLPKVCVQLRYPTHRNGISENKISRTPSFIVGNVLFWPMVSRHLVFTQNQNTRPLAAELWTHPIQLCSLRRCLGQSAPFRFHSITLSLTPRTPTVATLHESYTKTSCSVTARLAGLNGYQREEWNVTNVRRCEEAGSSLLRSSKLSAITPSTRTSWSRIDTSFHPNQ